MCPTSCTRVCSPATSLRMLSSESRAGGLSTVRFGIAGFRRGEWCCPQSEGLSVFAGGTRACFPLRFPVPRPSGQGYFGREKAGLAGVTASSIIHHQIILSKIPQTDRQHHTILPISSQPFASLAKPCYLSSWNENHKMNTVGVLLTIQLPRLTLPQVKSFW